MKPISLTLEAVVEAVEATVEVAEVVEVEVVGVVDEEGEVEEAARLAVVDGAQPVADEEDEAAGRVLRHADLPMTMTMTTTFSVSLLPSSICAFRSIGTASAHFDDPPAPAPPARSRTTKKTATSAPTSRAAAPAPVRPPSSAAATSDEVKCECGVQAATRTVVKDNENKGRQFYKCGENDACNFFAWADAPAAGTSSRATTSRAKAASSTSGKECNCPAPAVQREVQKEGPTQGQKFWACSKPQSEGCGFFEWVNNPKRGGGNGGSFSRDGATGGRTGARAGGGSGGGGGGGSGQECFKVFLFF